MSHEQIPQQTSSNSNSNSNSNSVSLLANKERRVCKLAVKVTLDTRISPEHNDEIKRMAQQYFGVGLRKRVIIEGKSDTALSAMADMVCKYGLEHINRLLDKQQQPTITTTFKKGKKFHRGDVKMNLIAVKMYLLDKCGYSSFIKGETRTKWGLTQIRSAIENVMDKGPRTVDEYIQRVCEGCGNAVVVGTTDSIFDLTHFFEREDLKPTIPKSKKNKRIGDYC